VQLRRVLRVAREGEQLRAGKAVGDVDRAAGETIEALDVIGLDLDIDAPNRRPRAPEAVVGG